MNVDVAYLLLRKLNLPNAIKGGLAMSWVVFNLFDVKGRVARATVPKKPT